MVVKKIIDQEAGRRWDIIKHEADRYSVNYYEYFSGIGWRNHCAGPKEYYTKAAIEFEFDCVVV